MDAVTLDFQTDVLDRSQEVPVLVDFWAEWCAPCRLLGPVLEEAVGEADGDWELVKVNTEVHQEIGQQYKISSIPAVKLFHRGQVIGEFTGALPKYQLDKWLRENLPDERLEQLQVLVEAWRNEPSEESIAPIAAFADKHIDLAEAKLLLAQILLQDQPERARGYLESVPQNHKMYEQATDLLALTELLAFEGAEAHPKVIEALISAKDAWKNRQVEMALTQLIQAIMMDKSVQQELARRATVAIFHQLGEDHPITKAYRPKFSMALY